jgi:thymidylate synthase
MRIYDSAYELMSETGRNLWEMGVEDRPKTYQNKVIEGDPDFITKELIAESYCLTQLPDPSWLFVYTQTRRWADEEFKERISGFPVNPGIAWELNKPMWEEFLVDNFFKNCPTSHPMSGIEKIFDYTYAERMSSKVAGHRYNGKTYLEAIIELLKEDNDTRKAVLSIFDADKDLHKLDGWARIPCSMYYQFLIRSNGKGEKVCNIIYNQRSSSFCGHFGDDVYLAWRLMEYVAKEVGVKPGYLYHQIGSLHCYQHDWYLLKTSIEDIMEDPNIITSTPK